MHQRLRDHGVPVSDIQELGGAPFVKSFYVYDPNKIALEIATFDLGGKDWGARGEGPWYNDPAPIRTLWGRPAGRSRL